MYSRIFSLQGVALFGVPIPSRLTLGFVLLQDCCMSACCKACCKICCKACYKACYKIPKYCCKSAAKLAARVPQSLLQVLLQDYCKIVEGVLQECLIQGLLQDCPPARPRFKIIALLQDFCKSAARMFDSRLAARLPARPPAPTLQDHCCKSAAWLLQGLL